MTQRVQQPFQPLPLGAIRPRGWLLAQLQCMAKGASGRLDELLPKLADDNAWLGGAGDRWEEAPYWLDGALPLAWLLDDGPLKAKVMAYVDWILDHQRPSGYFGPLTKSERDTGKAVAVANCEDGEDWWPKMVVLKVLQQYHGATGDPRVLAFMQRYFDYQAEALARCPMPHWTEWAAARATDNVMLVQWLHGITGAPELLALAERIEAQAYPWSDWFGARDWVMAAAANHGDQHWMRRHGVNVSMALKAPAITYQRTGQAAQLANLKTGWNDLMLLHGLPMGMFSGDEDLHGNRLTRGVELCSVVETMYSLEQIIAITGDVQYMDALERIAYNALPAQTTPDHRLRQYYQMANQVALARGDGDFNYTHFAGRQTSQVFGLCSGYTCCTTNMHQGWPKFASHLWYATDDGGIAALEYAPCEAAFKLGGQTVTVRETTDYPFDEDIHFDFSLQAALEFPLKLRIPSWCAQATVSLNGAVLRHEAGGQVITLQRIWREADRVSLRLPMHIRVSRWAENSRAVERGPLLYALKVGERWQRAEDPEEGEYFSIHPTQAWNYGLPQQALEHPEGSMQVNTQAMPEGPVWSQQHVPISITVPARKIPGWQALPGVAHQPVTQRDGHFTGAVANEAETVTLIPYGASRLRISAFPVVKQPARQPLNLPASST